MELYGLKTLHLETALGIDRTPYFSWKMTSERYNVLQVAYRIEVSDKCRVVWDSGKVESRQQSFVEYQGDSLNSRTEYRWHLTVLNNYDEESHAEAVFETAFLSKDNWTAHWIESTIPRKKVAEYKYGYTSSPVLFEKDFFVTKPAVRARLYATSVGAYRLRINETRPDDREFAPEFTAYDKILYYQTYDVTDLLKTGHNSLDMYVGDGWYFSQQTSPVMQNPHDVQAVLFQLEIEYSDGTSEVICSDGSETCALGAIEYSDIFIGEKQDLRKEFSEKRGVAIKNLGVDLLKAQPMPPVRAMKEIPAVDIFISPVGETIVDFGQILAGRARIYLDLPKDQEVIFEYFEILNKDGNYSNTMFAPQKDIVISNGKPCVHEALFTFHGFQYIRVTGLENARKEDFTAVLLTTEKESLAEFKTSDARLNRLYQNIRWSQANNMMSIPTDCPSREKAGWTGDILIYAKTALINEDVTPFLTSWLDNVEADQAENGNVMIITPYTNLYNTSITNMVKTFGDSEPTGVAGWSDAIVWVPYEMYQVTGNKLILQEKYQSMKKWCDYIIRTAKTKRGNDTIPVEHDQYLWNTGFHFGEWLIPSDRTLDGNVFEICKVSAAYIAPFFGFKTISLMSEIAGILGHEDKLYYADIAAKMKNAIQKGILYQDRLPKHLMGAYVMAFAFELVPDDLKNDYEKRLLDLIATHDGCLDTGFLATPFLLDVLSNLGHPKLAHDLLWQNKMPSWLYEVDQGATAIWEAWDADEAGQSGRLVSFDHYAFGCVDDWMFRRIAGIDHAEPGFSRIIIKPENDDRISFCHRKFECEAGVISVNWNRDELNIDVPCNTTALVTWKGQEMECGSGKYTIQGG